ncbi:MAG: GxxExxY protein [Bacteroidia bacterium]|nr:GxxExxY protein [Bacteroidia bacterium]
MDENNFLYKELSYELIGIFYKIRNEYGPGHKEKVYQNIYEEFLISKQIPYKREVRINVYSSETGKIVGTYVPDFVIDDKIIVEFKSSKYTTITDEKTFYHYLRNSKFEVGYLVNFSTQQFYIKRIIYTNDRKPFLKTTM